MGFEILRLIESLISENTAKITTPLLILPP
jgi:hypothetical protein